MVVVGSSLESKSEVNRRVGELNHGLIRVYDFVIVDDE